MGVSQETWRVRRQGRARGNLLCILCVRALLSYGHFTEVLFSLWSAFTVTIHPSTSPSLLSYSSFITFDFFLAQRPRADPYSITNLCELRGAESMFITCVLVKLWSSSALAMFRFKCLYDFFFWKIKNSLKNVWWIKHFLAFHTLIQSREIFQWQQISTDFQLD